MGKVFERLSDEDKMFVRANWESFKSETHLLAVSVRECMARVLTRHPDEERKIERYRNEISEELYKSEILSNKRGGRKDLIISEVPDKLFIYSGTVTASLLKVDYSDEMKTKTDTVLWTLDEDDGTREPIDFRDVEIMSAIYTLIKSQPHRINSFVDVWAEDVFRLMHPVNNYNRHEQGFIETLNETIDKFNSLHGKYTELRKDGEDKVIYADTASIDPSSCFFFVSLDKFDEKGYAQFSDSRYQHICERQGRCVPIDTSLLKGDTYEQDIMLAYLAYRHEQKNQKKQAIKLETMKKLLNMRYSEMFGGDPAILKKIIRKKLKPLFKDVDVDVKRRCITWVK